MICILIIFIIIILSLFLSFLFVLLSYHYNYHMTLEVSDTPASVMNEQLTLFNHHKNRVLTIIAFLGHPMYKPSPRSKLCHLQDSRFSLQAQDDDYYYY